jgi:hypothetical protein
MRRRIAISTVALLLVSLPSLGAEIFYLDHDPVTGEFVGPIGPLVLSGEIIPGDSDRLLSRILDDENRFLMQNKIMLASDGGDVAEALKIAKLVKSLFTQVVVGPLTGRCVSACFFIYAAAGRREADGERLIGINRPYIADAQLAPVSPSDAALVENGALLPVRAFLQENAVPVYLVDEMFRHASDDAYWLSAEDVKNLGYSSRSFNQLLLAKCAWDDTFDREVYAGKRSADEMKQMVACRDRVTQEAARKVLLLARQQKLPSIKPHARVLTDGPAVSAPPRSSSE